MASNGTLDCPREESPPDDPDPDNRNSSDVESWASGLAVTNSKAFWAKLVGGVAWVKTPERTFGLGRKSSLACKIGEAVPLCSVPLKYQGAGVNG